VKRRELLIVLGGVAVAWPLAARAQQKAMPVIGYLGGTSPGPYAAYVAAFRQGLVEEAGYVEGQNLAIEYRWAEGHYERLPAQAVDLVDRKVDVIVTSGGAPSALAAKSATSTTRSSSRPAIRSQTAWSPVSPGRAATSRASAYSPAS